MMLRKTNAGLFTNALKDNAWAQIPDLTVAPEKKLNHKSNAENIKAGTLFSETDVYLALIKQKINDPKRLKALSEHLSRLDY